MTNFSDGWNSDALAGALEAWRDAGAYLDMGMEPEDVADAVCYSLAQRAGVAVDLLEVRPNRLISKSIF